MHIRNIIRMKSKKVLFILIVSLSIFSFKTINKRLYNRHIFNSELNGTPYIIIDKSDYELKIYDDDGWYATYPVVFGSKNLGDKMMEGDRKTPEGTFKVISKRPHQKWEKMLLLNYPTPADIAKFNQRKLQGIVPLNAKIGGGIGIHGTWPRDEMAVDYFQNWTNGCISMKREEIQEVYRLIPIGTRVTIQR
jgi:murein L,D-transpeptidase YafK